MITDPSLGHIRFLLPTGLLQLRVTDQFNALVYHVATKMDVFGPEVIVYTAEGDWIRGEPNTVLQSLLSHLSNPAQIVTPSAILAAPARAKKQT